MELCINMQISLITRNTYKHSNTNINSLIWYRWFVLIDYIRNHHSTVCRIFSSLKKFLRVSICHESCLYECWIINNENINAEKLNRIICLFVISYRFSNKFTNYVSDRLMFILLIDTYLLCKKAYINVYHFCFLTWNITIIFH